MAQSVRIRHLGCKKEGTQDGDDEGRVLPAFSPGEQGPHTPALVKKTTQPPKPYTEGSLLRAMEGAGRTVDDEELREAMKKMALVAHLLAQP